MYMHMLILDYFKIFVLCISAHLIQYRKVSIKIELEQLIFHVKEKFSEVLLPVESVTKLEMCGKGT